VTLAHNMGMAVLNAAPYGSASWAKGAVGVSPIRYQEASP